MIKNESGSIIFLILVGVALFAALAYAFTQGSRTNVGFIQDEMTKAESTKGSSCDQAVASAIKRLQLRGCNEISGETNPAIITNTRCAVYHTEGGGIAPCNSTVHPACTVATIGQLCPDGTAYAGISPDGGKRMYMTSSETNQVWGSLTLRNATSVTSGKSNTTILAGFGEPAASYCDSLTSHGKTDWYLPARNEMTVLYTNRASLTPTVGFYNISWANYWTSTETNAGSAHVQEGGGTMRNDYGKGGNHTVRCIRTDP